MSDEIVVPEYCLVALDAARVALRLLGESVVLGMTLKNVTDTTGFYKQGRLTQVIHVHALTTRRRGQVTVLCHVHQDSLELGGWWTGKVSATWKGLTEPYTFDFESWAVPRQLLSERLEAAKIMALRAMLEVCRQIDAETGGYKTVTAFLENLRPENVGISIFTGDLGAAYVSVRPGLDHDFELARCFLRMKPIVPTDVVLNIDGLHPFRLQQGRWERIKNWPSSVSIR